MDLINLLLLGLIYVLVTAFSGRVFLECLNVNYKNEVLNFIVGFLIVETLSFLTFIIFGLLGFKNFLLSFLPNIFFAGIPIFYFFKRKFFFLPKFRLNSILWRPSLFLFFAITGLYFLNGSEVFFNVLNSSGIIYQDIIYHGGIAQSMINFGYPVYDLQFNEKLLNYHYFTHFLAAKVSYISFSNVFISYHIFLNFLGTLIYSFLSVSLFQFVFLSSNFKSKYSELIIGASGFSAFFCTFWLGGFMNNAFISAFYLSASFQWQLIMMLTFFLLLFNINYDKIPLKHIVVLTVLLFASSLIKVSSLPLIIAGVGAVLLYNLFFFNKKMLKTWIPLFLIFMVGGFVTFISFFNVGASQSSTLEFNIDLLKLTPIIAYFKIDSIFLSLIIYLITVISFRFVLIYKLRKAETWFVGSILLTGLVLSLLVKDNQAYFIFPSIILSSHLAIIYLFKINLKNLVLLSFLFFLILSFYPIGGLGVTLKDKLKEKRQYYPLNSERLELYSWIKENSGKNDIFFTTTNYASQDMMADNYAPAAFSGRKVFLGGFRFGGLEYEDEFQKRLEVTKNFNFRDEEIWNLLKEENIEFGLIERNGNFDDDLFITARENLPSNLYQIVFSNSQGIIFKIREEG